MSDAAAMALPISAWHNDHVYFNELLGRLRRELDVFHHGERPDYERMAEIVTYLREYGDAIHHPRESVAFEAILGGAMVPRAELEVALATYLVYYGNHIAKEEEDVLARAAMHLGEEDWKAVRTVRRYAGVSATIPPVLEARDLECERGGKALFRQLGFALAPGETLRIAGPNGSGKTSLLRILCGLLTPTAGEVLWNGARIQALREEYARHVLYLGHAAAVKDELTGAENLRVACVLAGLAPSAEQTRDALARFSVPGDKPVRQLSQGQRRRAALARLSVSGQAAVWLLDEPFTALDAAAAEVTRTLLGEHAQRGGSVVYSTHQDAGLRDSRVIEL